MKKITWILIGAALGITPALVRGDVTTQTETLTGTVIPGNDQDYAVAIFDANGLVTAGYLPVEQEAGDNSFSLPVLVPLSQTVNETVTVLSVYGGNGGTNDSPVSVVLNAASAATATATGTANGMNGPQTFATMFPGANEVTIFNDLETGNLTDIESFVSANASEFVTLTDGRADGSVVPFSQINPGEATFSLEVPEPDSFWILLAGAGAVAGTVELRRRR